VIDVFDPAGVAVRYRDGRFVVHPDGDLEITSGGRMVAIWARGQWQRVEIL
jgi:Trk K+ transport system NAD-binding subunit